MVVKTLRQCWQGWSLTHSTNPPHPLVHLSTYPLIFEEKTMTCIQSGRHTSIEALLGIYFSEYLQPESSWFVRCILHISITRQLSRGCFSRRFDCIFRVLLCSSKVSRKSEKTAINSFEYVLVVISDFSAQMHQRIGPFKNFMSFLGLILKNRMEAGHITQFLDLEKLKSTQIRLRWLLWKGGLYLGHLTNCCHRRCEERGEFALHASKPQSVSQHPLATFRCISSCCARCRLFPTC